ncbi:glycosyltransferase [Pseudocnuella soli]|uniref:glycosyltransferase n=1 Tax=Pseudocnuella soli TaxID=2502779 RepID=UPI0014049C02|nr:glycosyltransferase [Pseudocnuella soli]
MYADKIAPSEKKPLISYVTVVLNGANDLHATIDSIVPHVCNEVEYIVVDGGSSDGTVSIIEQYGASISKWVSEKDTGIYDAMNKGIRLAKGDYICFINIGDRLLHCPLQQLRCAASQNAAAVSFPVKLSNGQLFSPSFSLKLVFENTMHHQGTYYLKDALAFFDISYKAFADFDINQKLFKANVKVVTNLEIINALHSLDGTSNCATNFPEIFTVVRKNFGTVAAWGSYLHFRFKYGLVPKIKRFIS